MDKRPNWDSDSRIGLYAAKKNWDNRIRLAKKQWDNRIRLAKKWDNRIRLAKKNWDNRIRLAKKYSGLVYDKRIRLAKKSGWDNRIRLAKKEVPLYDEDTEVLGNYGRSFVNRKSPHIAAPLKAPLLGDLVLALQILPCGCSICGCSF